MFVRIRQARSIQRYLPCFRFSPNDKSFWVIEKLDTIRKVYKCYNLKDKDITLYVPYEQIIWIDDEQI